MKINLYTRLLQQNLKNLAELEPPFAARAKNVLSNSGLRVTSFQKSNNLLGGVLGL